MSREGPPSQPVSREDKIRRLVASREAVDERDAEEALHEDEEAGFIRGIDRKEYLAKIEAALLEAESGSRDRWELNFNKAVVAVAETPDDLEFLAYNMLRDLITKKSEDETERRRQESAKHRLDKKMNNIAAKMGMERANGLFQHYRQMLQELLDSQG